MKRFPRLYVVAWAALAVAVACMTANAQPQRGKQRPGGPGGGPGMRRPGGPGFGGPGMMGRGGLVGLLMIEEVRKEIGLTSDQEAKLREYGEKRREEMRKRFAGMQDLSREERQKRFEQMREQFAKEAEKAAKEAQKFVQGILKPDQFKRLMQIELQQQARRQGPEVLLRPDIVQALGLTDDQKSSLEKIVGKLREQREAMGAETRKLFEGMRDMSREERGKAMEKARERMTASREKGQQAQAEAQKAAMAVLTSEQKGKLKQVMGEAFKMPEFRGFRRGGPGGEGGRGGPGGEGRRGGGGDRGGRRGGGQGPGGGRRGGPARA